MLTHPERTDAYELARTTERLRWTASSTKSIMHKIWMLGENYKTRKICPTRDVMWCNVICLEARVCFSGRIVTKIIFFFYVYKKKLHSAPGGGVVWWILSKFPATLGEADRHGEILEIQICGLERLFGMGQPSSFQYRAVDFIMYPAQLVVFRFTLSIRAFVPTST